VKKVIFWTVGIVVVCAVGLLAADQFTPWPRALYLRHQYDSASRATSQSLTSLVPANVTAVLDQAYDPPDEAVRLDVFHPAGGIPNPNDPSERVRNEAVVGVRTNITF